jgi:hypothetical protein
VSSSAVRQFRITAEQCRSDSASSDGISYRLMSRLQDDRLGNEKLITFEIRMLSEETVLIRWTLEAELSNRDGVGSS